MLISECSSINFVHDLVVVEPLTNRDRAIASLDLERLTQLLEFSSVGELQAAHRQWGEETLASGHSLRDPAWTEAIAIGSEDFTTEIKTRLGVPGLPLTAARNDAWCMLWEDPWSCAT